MYWVTDPNNLPEYYAIYYYIDKKSASLGLLKRELMPMLLRQPSFDLNIETECAECGQYYRAKLSGPVTFEDLVECLEGDSECKCKLNRPSDKEFRWAEDDFDLHKA